VSGLSGHERAERLRVYFFKDRAKNRQVDPLMFESKFKLARNTFPEQPA